MSIGFLAIQRFIIRLRHKLMSADVIQPLLLSTIFFAIGYQLRPLLSPTPPAIAASSRSVSSQAPPAKRARAESDEEATDTESEAEDEAAATSANVGSLRARVSEEVKLVLVVNDSLKMSKGKIAAQAGHATLACAFMVKEQNPKVRPFPHSICSFMLYPAGHEPPGTAVLIVK